MAAGVVLVLTVVTVWRAQGWGLLHVSLKTLEPLLMLFLVGMALLFLGAGELSIDGRATGGGGGAGAKAPKKKAA
jgi:hypothetical protein